MSERYFIILTCFTTVLLSFHKQIGSKDYHNETTAIQKRLQKTQLKLSTCKRHISARQGINSNAPSIYTINETSVWTPGNSSCSLQLSSSDYSLSAIDMTPPHVYTDVSEIQNNSNSSPRHRNSKANLQEPLHSSMQYPQNSTPRQVSTSNIQRECLSECVRHLVFGDVTVFSDGNQTTATLDNSYSLDSGYSSFPDPSCDCQNSLVDDELNTSFSSDDMDDSDISGFFESALTHLPVTHKPAKKHNLIAKQLKCIGKHISKILLSKA